MKAATLSGLIIFIVCSISQIPITIAQPVLACATCNNTNGNYTSKSIYGKNLKTLLNIISSYTQFNNGFYNLSVGQAPDAVYGIAICRGDRSPSDCRSFLSDAAQMLTDDCPVQKEAIGYYFGYCMLRYSNRPIFKFRDNSLNCTVPQSPQTIPGPDLRKFTQSLGTLLKGLKLKASSGNSSYKFSSGYQVITPTLDVYALAQCNPDLSFSECSNCLQGVMGQLEQCCSTWNGAGSYGPICSVQFGNYPLINSFSNTSLQPIAPATANSDSSHNKSGNRRGRAYKIWIIVVSVVSFMLIASLVSILFMRKMRKRTKQEDGNGQVKLVDSLQLDFSSIQLATDNFSDARRLGNGSAATMYKGTFPDGQEIVVRKLHKAGRDSELEFDNEVLLTSNLQHKNLVKLLGFCVEKDLRFLVYEFLPNGSLYGFLNDPIKGARLDWQTRYHIIGGLSRGLLYLHEDSQVRVIHRDIKPNNILLGAQMDSKISNFRKSSLIPTHQTNGDIRVVGTYGYMPLEYVKHGHSSIKSDVFSYGVILLEIITGYTIAGFSESEKEESLLTYVWKKWCNGSALDVVDKAIPNIQRHVKQIKGCIKIALLCVQEDPRQRPTMSTVVLMLNSDTVDIIEPIRPSPLVLNNMDPKSDGYSIRTDASHESSVNEISITYLDPR